jgi:hypothetical protein
MARDGATRKRGIAAFALAAAASWIATGAPRAEDPASLVILGPEFSESQRIVRQREWATNLVEVLGLAPALPEDSHDADVIGLLCPEGAERITEVGGRRLPVGSAFRVVVEAPRGRSPADPVRAVVSLPATSVYMLTVEGTGPQRWVVDQRPIGHLDASPLGVAQAPALVPLRRGPHELTAYLTSAARVDRAELAAYRPLCIAPAAGWNPDRPLTFADEARTLVRSLGIEQRLPASGEPISIEGESFDKVSAWGERTNRLLGVPASAHTWAIAMGSPAEFSYRVRLEDPGVFTLEASLHGSGPQLWSIDGHYRVTAQAGEGSETFAWAPVITLPLTAGEHVIRALVPRDGGIDVIKLVRRRSRDEDYLSLIEEAGFRGGAPAAYVTRAAAFASLSNSAFSEHAQHFLARVLDREDPVFLVENNLEPLYSRPLSPLLPPEL